MRLRSTPQVILWAFCVLAGVVSGGSIYEMLVVWPLWADSPPESVRAWTHGGIQAAFFAPLTPLYAFAGLALIAATRWIPAQQRRWAVLAGISAILVGLATFLFFVPILRKTQFTGGAGLSGEEITALVRSFETWQWARWVALIGGWLAALRALSLSRASDPER